MKLKDGRRRYNLTLMLGNWFLIAGALSQRILIRGFHMNENLADGITGMFYGMTIACFIIGIRKMKHESQAS